MQTLHFTLHYTIQKLFRGETGPQGPQGIQGETGKDFSIYKTYTTIDLMNADKANVAEGTQSYYDLKGNWFSNVATNADQIENTGGDEPHNNLQPYITCYMWKRTA